MIEEWKEVPGFPGYEASTSGRIRSWRKRGFGVGQRRAEPLVLRGAIKSKTAPVQYLFVCLYRGTGPDRVAMYVHHIIASAFHGPRPEGHEVLHGDGDSMNNCPANLRYGTRSENTRDQIRHGTHRWSR